MTAVQDSATLIDKTCAFVREHMSVYDASHDWAHIERVRSLAERLAACSPVKLRADIVTLAALLHDIGDAKYTQPGDSQEPVRVFLESGGADARLAADVQRIVSHVSFSKEKRDPAAVLDVLRQHPELGVVQDADRLDAIGAVGIGRCFTYGATRAAHERTNGAACSSSSMDDAIIHFQEKLERLEGMMKTEEGRRLARERTERLQTFRTWWAEEQGGT